MRDNFITIRPPVSSLKSKWEVFYMQNPTTANTGSKDGRGELSPFLIGSTHTINPIFDPSQGSCYSVDMIRFQLRSRPNEWSRIQKALDMWICPVGGLTVEDDGETKVLPGGRLQTYTGSNGIGGYRFMWAWRFDDRNSAKVHAQTSIAVGYCHIEGSGKTNEGAGFLEYNPNKLHDEGAALIRYLQGHGVKLESVRYDLAIDFPVARDAVRTLKDGRNYEAHISDALTEYLGQRNKPGRVKVYDKTAEAGLDDPLTRVELTVDATWSAEKIMEQLPTVFSYAGNGFEGFRGITKAFALAVQAHIDKGDVAEPWLRLIDPKTKAKIRAAFKSQAAVEYSQDCVEGIVDRVAKWVQTA